MHQQSARTGDNAIRDPKVGSPLPTTIQTVSQQDGFGNNRTQPTGPSEPDDDDDGMQEKSENVAHVRMLSTEES